MSLSKDDILNAIAEMSVMDVVDLVAAMEEKFGVSAAAAVAVAGPAAGGRRHGGEPLRGVSGGAVRGGDVRHGICAVVPGAAAACAGRGGHGAAERAGDCHSGWGRAAGRAGRAAAGLWHFGSSWRHCAGGAARARHKAAGGGVRAFTALGLRLSGVPCVLV